MARIRKKSKWNHTYKTLNGCNHKIGRTKDIKTTQITNGKHTTPTQVHPQPLTIRSPTTTTTFPQRKKNSNLDWNEEHTNSFQQIKNTMKQIIQNKHSDTNQPTRVRCDASKKGLGARTKIRQRVAPQRIRKQIPKYKRTKIQHKFIRTTISCMVTRTLQILPIRITFQTPNGSPSPAIGPKRQ